MTRRRTIATGIAVFLMIGAALLLAETPAWAQSALKSANPRCAKVVLTKDGKRVLSVIFDESRGTGTGYDVLYADTNFNGSFGQTERYPIASSRGSSRSFKPIKLNLPYSEKGKGTANPCVVSFSCTKSRGRGGDSFHVTDTIELREGSVTWQYVFDGVLKTSSSFRSAPVLKLNASPEPRIDVGADKRRRGYCGIALELCIGDTTIQCKSRKGAPKAELTIKTVGGSVVHQKAGTLDTFGYG